jgi:hypothetical protein
MDRTVELESIMAAVGFAVIYRWLVDPPKEAQLLTPVQGLLKVAP